MFTTTTMNVNQIMRSRSAKIIFNKYSKSRRSFSEYTRSASTINSTSNFNHGINLTFEWYFKNKAYYKSFSKRDILRRLGKIW